MDRVSRHTQGVEEVRFGDVRIGCLLFADDVFLLVGCPPEKGAVPSPGRGGDPATGGGLEGKMEREINRRIGAESA